MKTCCAFILKPNKVFFLLYRSAQVIVVTVVIVTAFLNENDEMLEKKLAIVNDKSYQERLLWLVQLLKEYMIAGCGFTIIRTW